jgi:hypothetical protein
MKTGKLTETYNNNIIHNELTSRIKNTIEQMGEFDVTPHSYVCESENQKSFGVLADNGSGGTIKRFTITIEDHKNF